MGIFGKSGCFGLFGREVALLLLRDLEELAECFTVGLCHDTILQL